MCIHLHLHIHMHWHIHVYIYIYKWNIPNQQYLNWIYLKMSMPQVLMWEMKFQRHPNWISRRTDWTSAEPRRGTRDPLGRENMDGIDSPCGAPWDSLHLPFRRKSPPLSRHTTPGISVVFHDGGPGWVLATFGQDNSVTPSKRRLAIRALTDLLFQLQTLAMGS